MAGPLTVAVVSFPVEILARIRRKEILPKLQDSKKLSPLERETLYPLIQEFSWGFSIQHISHHRIDQWGIQEATFYGIYKAMRKFHSEKTFLIMDGNYSWKNCKNLSSSLHPKSISIIQADQTIVSVQAASVLAKVARDRYMMRMARKYPIYGFEQHKGYGTQFHREQIQKWGPSPIHRKTFIRKLG